MKVGNYPVNAQNVNQQNVSNTVSQQNIQVNTPAGNAGLPQTLSSLSQGEIFEATITRDESGKIIIHLANGESVSARMEGAVPLLENTATFFQVKSNQGGQLALKAVTQNPSANPTLIKALAQAGVAIDEANLHLVQEMMKQQLPIDSKSLANMVRLAYGNKGVQPSTLVQMTKLGIPVTQDNVQQFQQYTSGEGSVVKTLDTIMQQLPHSLENYQSAGMEGKDVLSRLQSVFLADGNLSQVGEGNILQGSMESVMTGVGDSSSTMSSGEVLQQVVQTPEMVEVEPSLTMQNESGGINLQENLQLQSTPEVYTVSEQGVSGSTTMASLEGLLQAGEVDFQELMRHLEQLSLKEENTGGRNLFNKLANYIQTLNINNEDYQTLFQNKGFKTLLTGMMEQEWLLKPEQVQGEKINEVYEKIQNQMSKLETLLQQLGQSEQALAQGTKDVRGNVQFMNDLNQFFNYVQIPLKMANENAKGDLYVYTDKRALKQGKEELTAHLHLELEHLGTTDVYVRLKEKKLATNFVMEKEESLDLVMTHIDVLTARLQSKGFTVTTKVELGTEETKAPDFMQEILNKELPSVAIQRYSLDVIV